MKYTDFLKSKMVFNNKTGFDIQDSEVVELAKPHQRDIIKWAIAGGKRAIFASFGLGKSLIQLEILRLINKHKGGKCLIIAPLGVRQEFKRDAENLCNIHLTFVRKSNEVKEDGFYITNYESVRDGKLDVNLFKAVTLDEASVLRSYGSKTYQSFLQIFEQVEYKFVATATPSPNKYKELIHYAGYLGIMDTGQALTRFFQRDSTQANNLTLYPHKEKEFWLWLHTWAIFLQKPSDLGYSDEGYDLPKLHVHYHQVKTDLFFSADRKGQMKMFQNAALSLSDASREKTRSLDERVSKMVEILEKQPNDNFILWHDQEKERHAINKAVNCKDVYGSLDLEKREERILDFSDGKYQYLSTKPILSGSGCNFQRHCNNAIYVGIGFKFNDWIQSVHRIMRFLQEKECHIHLIYTDTERHILSTLKTKWANHNKMVENMSKLIRKHGLSALDMEKELSRSFGCKRIEVTGDKFTAVNNDCVEETKTMEANSVDLIHTSIPFSNHYEYSPSYNDFGHNSDNDNFFGQMDYLTPELLRILKPGRVAAIHVKDRILFGNVTGYGMPSVDPFHVTCIQHYRDHGFIYFGMITVVTDVVRENNQTYRLGWTEQCKDGSKMGVGSPEYILLFRKLPSDTSKAYADEKVVKSKEEYTRAQWQTDAHAFWRSSGDRLLDVDEMRKYPIDKIGKLFTEHMLENIYNYESHVKIGKELDLKGVLPSTFMLLDPASHNENVWTDISRMKTLNSEQRRRCQNMHICPANIDWVDRIINRYSNKDDLVYDPFGGIMTIPYRALKLGRRGCGCELNPQYFKDGCKYLDMADREIKIPSLFDFEKAANV